MNQNEEDMLGTRRRMTPQEVGMIVRMYRESNQVKRAALAAQANVSEKTLERLEAGVPVQETTYRRVAIALGIAEDSFIREEYIPTPEEYLHRQEAEQAKFKKTHTKVDVARLIDPVKSWRCSERTPAWPMTIRSRPTISI